MPFDVYSQAGADAKFLTEVDGGDPDAAPLPVTLRRGTTAEWTAANPVLAAGEPAVVLDSGQPAELVLGDGVTAMADLRAAVWDDDARLTLAGTATQPGDLGTAAAADVADFATAAQGAKADTAVQPATLAAEVATRAPGASSPRGTSRVLNERRPVLTIDRAYPNDLHDHAVLGFSGGTMYLYGRDRTLRSTGNYGSQVIKLANSGAGVWARLGIFLRTAAGSLITTYHPDAGGAPSIVRSNNLGLSFTEVISARTNIEYQGATSIAQDPNTGRLYLSEYVTVGAATVPTFKILKSDDDGATWSTFHEFNRAGAGAVRHGHGVQWDPIGGRMFFLTGDSEAAAGMYRTNSGATALEPVFLNSHGVGGQKPATAVGMMFFPDAIAWGMDQTTDSEVIRVSRDQIGATTPAYESVGRLQSTAFHCVRTKADNTEWLMSVSNENLGAGSVDPQVTHLYRVADNATTLDEVAAFNVLDAAEVRYAQPVGSNPLHLDPDGLAWIGIQSNGVLDRLDGVTLGSQYAVRLGWGTQSHRRADESRRPFYAPTAQSSGLTSLTASQTKVFGGVKVPASTRKLYIMDMGCLNIAGAGGAVKVQVWNATTGALLTDSGSGAALESTFQSVRENRKQEAGSHVYVTGLINAGDVLHFRIVERTGVAVDGTAFVSYAFGY